MTIFKYIEDKDVFQKFYSKMLANRLIRETSASEDAESSMIGKLKDACGFEYTSKLQRMFQDMSINKDTNAQFKEKMAQTHDSADLTGEHTSTRSFFFPNSLVSGVLMTLSFMSSFSIVVDFAIQVLGTAAWPLSAPTTNLNMPAELVKTKERFEAYYMNKHSGRKLTWIWQHCRNELSFPFYHSSSVVHWTDSLSLSLALIRLRTLYTPQKYMLVTSTFQACILLQFNTSDSLSYEEIETGTGMAAETLKPVLGLLTKARVIELKDGNYELNLGFKSKKIKVNLNAPIKAEQKQESAAVLKVR